jgi:50S ribosomal subunit-associated GTPase HflX
MRDLSKCEIPIGRHARFLYEIQAILSEIEGLKREIEKLDAQIAMRFFIGPGNEKVRARKSLKTRVENLLSQLEQISKRKETNE